MAITYVVDGAIIECSQGIGESTLEKGCEWNLELHDQKILTVGDNVVNKNVQPFPLCKSPNNPAVKAGGMKPVPCNPVICKKWIKGKTDFILKGEMALTSECLLSCMYGGIIEIVDDGQRK
ncbi:DUF4280 domain-containing protein [Clostridium saccharoperbutylacetonicum]|uniref:DUF4280 domain-containing protein n=1 Tax=Clostridium saccharoperbutylacetonicum TaxID=36745 RepID=UPI000983EEDC|nr:DUF4280 domain-containing protein [Clostridium saccharoperbutylacetonicum]AQR96127.1 hypothetical protein CLSAP_34460 [Clostridium saccharoperbutylacetonicum]NSB31996.1 hypothetical protein [Clostridium saccharoperbutylacetonicum]